MPTCEDGATCDVIQATPPTQLVLLWSEPATYCTTAHLTHFFLGIRQKKLEGSGHKRRLYIQVLLLLGTYQENDT